MTTLHIIDAFTHSPFGGNPAAVCLLVQKVQRGQRQYALFAGLNKEGSACGHVSENGASSFLTQ